jgi:membrane protein YdbS with pleckstrin-like domain
MAGDEPISKEEKLKNRYLKASKFLFLITMIYALWIAITILGAYFLKLGSRWAVFSIEQWILSGIIFISIVIVLEILFILHYLLSTKKRLESEPEKNQYIQGKKIHSYTLPADAKGGIFSKTFILINEENVLNLRYQMIPPHDLWE